MLCVDVQVRMRGATIDWEQVAIARAISGFSNTTSGGVLICGVKDKTKEIVGVADPPTLISWITQAVQNCTFPPSKISVSSMTYYTSPSASVELVVIDVPPGSHLTEAG